MRVVLSVQLHGLNKCPLRVVREDVEEALRSAGFEDTVVEIDESAGEPRCSVCGMSYLDYTINDKTYECKCTNCGHLWKEPV